MSFLPHSEHGFTQAPLEDISEEEYRQRKSSVVQISEGPHGGMSELLDDDCFNGSCPIR